MSPARLWRAGIACVGGCTEQPLGDAVAIALEIAVAVGISRVAVGERVARRVAVGVGVARVLLGVGVAVGVAGWRRVCVRVPVCAGVSVRLPVLDGERVLLGVLDDVLVICR